MFVYPLSFSPLHGLLTHINQAGLRFAVGEIADCSDGLVGEVLSKGMGLFNTVALADDITSLQLVTN